VCGTCVIRYLEEARLGGTRDWLYILKALGSFEHVIGNLEEAKLSGTFD
jgi:hypothetical protein